MFCCLQVPEKKTETPKTSRPAKQTLSLFDDDEEEEEGDLFGAPTAKPATAKPSSASKVRSEESLRFADASEHVFTQLLHYALFYRQQKPLAIV